MGTGITGSDGAAPMRIVHITRQYLPGIGGIENFVSLLAAGQAQAGHQVRVVTLDRIFDGGGVPPARERHAGVEVVRVPFVGIRKYPLAPHMLAHVGDADIVHVHGIEFAADFLAATRWLHRRPMVISTHGGIFHTATGGGLKRLWFATITRLSLNSYRTVIASSVQDAETFAPIAPGKVVLVENAVDTRKFAGLADPSATTMLYFGRLAPGKQLDRLLRWFAAIHRAAPAWCLVIAGKEMGTRVATLEALAVELGIADAVEFHLSPGDAQLGALIARSSVFACASRYEGFGIAAVEATAAGLFPVLSDIPAFRRTVERTGIGMMWDFDAEADPALFLKRFQLFAEQPDRAAVLPERIASFAWPGVLAQIEGVYAAACAGRGAVAEPREHAEMVPMGIIPNSPGDTVVRG